MREPEASQFGSLVRRGAGSRDIQGGGRDTGFATATPASDAFVAREVSRVDAHSRSSCRLLEAFVGPSAAILDVGCSTGGSTVALSLSPGLRPEIVFGVDPDPLSLRAAETRARGYGLRPDRVAFLPSVPGSPLPFRSGSFDLVSCISVLEFVPTHDARRRLVDEMKRLVRPGGHVFVATPNPFRARELHSRRWLGDALRREGYPWAPSPWALRALFAGCERVPIEGVDGVARARTHRLERAACAARPRPSPRVGEPLAEGARQGARVTGAFVAPPIISYAAVSSMTFVPNFFA